MSKIKLLGELIQDQNLTSFNPMLDIRADWIPTNHNWRMIRYAIKNSDILDMDNLMHMESEGWRPVPASTRPEFAEFEYKGGVLYKGLILSYKQVTVAIMSDGNPLDKSLTNSLRYSLRYCDCGEPLDHHGKCYNYAWDNFCDDEEKE